MAKRLGANSRKRNAVKKDKIRITAKKVTGRLIVGILALGLVGAICFGGFKGFKSLSGSIKKSDLFNVTDVIVKGNNHIDTQIIMEKCGLTNASKTFLINESSIRAALMSNPWIENVDVSKKSGGKVVLSVKERKPIALVNLKKIYYVDKNGVLFPIAKKAISEMPVLSGLKDSVDSCGLRKICSKDMNRVNTFLSSAAMVDENFLHSITQIDFSDTEKISLSFQAFSTLVEINQDDIITKLEYLQRLEDVLQNEAEVPQKINLCYQNLAFVITGNTVKSDSVHAIAN